VTANARPPDHTPASPVVEAQASEASLAPTIDLLDEVFGSTSDEPVIAASAEYWAKREFEPLLSSPDWAQLEAEWEAGNTADKIALAKRIEADPDLMRQAIEVGLPWEEWERPRSAARRGETEEQAWPDAPDPAAYRGLAGDIVRAVQDGTEADPVAILAAILTIFGVLVGDRPYLYHGGIQRANLYTVLVGETASGRKGTSWSVAIPIFDLAEPGWNRILVPGLGSGEGLINRLAPKDGAPAPDPRALIFESEFARLLAVMGREGSTLSATIRDGWDGVPLGRFLARESSIVLRHHVGLVGHVTSVELRTRLTGTDAANGYGNRHLWLAVRRTRLLPFPVDVRTNCPSAPVPRTSGRRSIAPRLSAHRRACWPPLPDEP